MDENGSLESHLLEFEKLVRKLKAVCANMEEEDIICQLLLSLPEMYDSVATALEIMKAEELTVEFVKGRLLDCDIKIKTNSIQNKQSDVNKSNSLQGANYDSSAMVGYNKKNIKCYICG